VRLETRDKIYWHEAFFEALQLELYEYKNILQFINEHPLSKEALLMDMLIVKKEKGVKIEKNIGRIFRERNVVEFKSESESFSIWDYYKVMGYVLLYASFQNVPLSDLTLTISLTIYPREVMKYFENERNFTIRDMGGGVYYIDDDVVPIQILESKRMTNEENIFLRNLRSNIPINDMSKTIESYKKIKPLDKRAVYLDRLLSANTLIYEEAKKMFEENINVIIRVAEERGIMQKRDEQKIAERIKQSAKEMLNDGEPAIKIAKWLKLPLEVVEAL